MNRLMIFWLLRHAANILFNWFTLWQLGLQLDILIIFIHHLGEGGADAETRFYRPDALAISNEQTSRLYR